MRFGMQSGFVKMIIIILATVIILGYFNIDVRGVIESPGVQKNLHYVSDVAQNIWTNYLRTPVLYFWQNVFLKFIWSSFLIGVQSVGHALENTAGNVDVPAQE